MGITTIVVAVVFRNFLRHCAGTNEGSNAVGLAGLLPLARSKGNSMLKINFSETPAEERWILHGQLTDPWVAELEACWKKTISRRN